MRGGEIVPGSTPSEDRLEGDIRVVVDRPVGIAVAVVLGPVPVQLVAVQELVGPDHPGVADIDYVRVGHVEPHPKPDQEQDRNRKPRRRDREAERTAGPPAPESQQQDAAERIEQEGVDERDGKPNRPVVEQRQRDREAEQHQQVELQQRPPGPVPARRCAAA